MKRLWITVALAVWGAAAVLSAADEGPAARDYMPAATPGGVLFPSGPCLVAATGLSRICELTDLDHQDDCSLLLTLYPDPQLGVVSYSGIFSPEVALDELGHSLVGPVKTGEVGVSGFTQYVPHKEAFKRVEKSTALQAEVALHLPADAGKKIADIKGVAHLRTAGKTTTLDIPAAEFAMPHSLEFHGTVVRIAAIRNIQQAPRVEYVVSVNFEHPNMSKADWDEVSQLVDVAKLSILDDKGVAWNQNGGGGGNSANSRSISAQFQADGFVPQGAMKAGAAALFRLTLADEIKDTPIAFEFKNLPIP